MRTLTCTLVAAGLLASCASIPLTTAARLTLNPEARIIESPSSELAIALTSSQPLPETMLSPSIVFKLQPKVAGTFRPLEEILDTAKIPAHAALTGSAAQKHQYVFVLTEESQQRLTRAQAYFGQLRTAKRAGSLTIAINMTSFSEASKRLPDHARLTAWLRTSQREGFLKMWSGSAVEARKQLAAPGSE